MLVKRKYDEIIKTSDVFHNNNNNNNPSSSISFSHGNSYEYTPIKNLHVGVYNVYGIVVDYSNVKKKGMYDKVF